MKKLVIGIALIVIISAIAPPKIYSQQNVQHVTLNNVDKKIFKGESSYFANHRKDGKVPEMASVWFSSDMISRMVTLLKGEGADGVRIYFIAEPPSGNDFKTSIAMVSTVTDAPANYKNQSIHRDYYDHDLSNVYFTTNPNSIIVHVQNDDCGGGALLYKNNNLSALTCINDDEHYVPVNDAEDWVQRFRDKKHPINTISVWYDIGLFKKLVDTGDYDGIRIYFCRKKGFLGVLRGRNRFLITTTTNENGIHKDKFDCKNPFFWEKEKLMEISSFLAAPPQDNGELCPTNCN